MTRSNYEPIQSLKCANYKTVGTDKWGLEVKCAEPLPVGNLSGTSSAFKDWGKINIISLDGLEGGGKSVAINELFNIKEAPKHVIKFTETGLHKEEEEVTTSGTIEQGKFYDVATDDLCKLVGVDNRDVFSYRAGKTTKCMYLNFFRASTASPEAIDEPPAKMWTNRELGIAHSRLVNTARFEFDECDISDRMMGLILPELRSVLKTRNAFRQEFIRGLNKSDGRYSTKHVEHMMSQHKEIYARANDLACKWAVHFVHRVLIPHLDNIQKLIDEGSRYDYCIVIERFLPGIMTYESTIPAILSPRKTTPGESYGFYSKELTEIEQYMDFTSESYTLYKLTQFFVQELYTRHAQYWITFVPPSKRIPEELDIASSCMEHNRTSVEMMNSIYYNTTLKLYFQMKYMWFACEYLAIYGALGKTTPQHTKIVNQLMSGSYKDLSNKLKELCCVRSVTDHTFYLINDTSMTKFGDPRYTSTAGEGYSAGTSDLYRLATVTPEGHLLENYYENCPRIKSKASLTARATAMIAELKLSTDK